MRRTRLSWLSVSFLLTFGMLLSACAPTTTTTTPATGATAAATRATTPGTSATTPGTAATAAATRATTPGTSATTPGTAATAATTPGAAGTATRPAGTPGTTATRTSGATDQVPGAVKGGTFIDSTFADAKTLQPLLSEDTASSAYIALHYGVTLLSREPTTLDWKPFAAKSYSISEDKMSIIYELRDDIQWSDGKKMTAADFKFTWDKMNDPQVKYPYRSNLRYFESLTVEGENRLVFKVKEVFAPALDYTVFTVIPKHVFENVDVNDNPQNNNPTVGSGPFLLKEWRKDQFAEFNANDKFFMGRPNLDRYLYKIVANQQVQYSQFKTGEVDSAGIQAIDWEEASKLPNAQPYNYYSASASWDYIGFNLRNDLLKDKKVRQAITSGLDRNTMIEAIRLGHAKPMDSTYASASWAYEPNVPKFTYDPKKANQLLDEAGWRMNASTKVREKDGKQLKMRIFYNSGNAAREKIATVAQEQLMDVGIQLEVIPEEWNAYLDRVTKNFDMELYVLGWSSGIEPFGFNNIWKTQKEGQGQQNSTGFSSADVDRLYDESVKVFEQAQRKQFYSQIQKILAEEQPYVFLWENESLVVYNNRIVLPYKNGESRLGPAVEVWKWYSKTGK